jgi:predicted permease
MRNLLLELIPCLLVGTLLGRRWPSLPRRLAPVLVHWGVPMALVGLLLRSGLRPELLDTALLALAGTGLFLLVIGTLPLLRHRIPSASLRLGSAIGNTTYWGLPVALALLPPEAIGHTISFDLIGTLLCWSTGPLLLRQAPARAGVVLGNLVASPAGRGLLIALPLQFTPWNTAVAAALWWPARLVVLLALTIVGMRLGAMRAASVTATAGHPGLPLALAMKLLLFPALLLLAAGWLGLPVVARDAVVLQAAAPTAVSVLLLCEAGGPAAALGEAEAAATLVLRSTLLAVVSVPLWWWLLSTIPPTSSGWPP